MMTEDTWQLLYRCHEKCALVLSSLSDKQLEDDDKNQT